MNNRQNKCPGCGLANFRAAAECQWCALALSGRARNELVDDAARPAGAPWGLLLMLFAVLAVGGGVVWHVARKAVARAEAAAEATEEADAAAKSPKRKGPPSLSSRGPHTFSTAEADAAMEKRRQEMQQFRDANPRLFENRDREMHDAVRRAAEDYNESLRRKMEEKQLKARQLEAARRAERQSDEEEQPPPPAPDDPGER